MAIENNYTAEAGGGIGMKNVATGFGIVAVIAAAWLTTIRMGFLTVQATDHLYIIAGGFVTFFCGLLSVVMTLGLFHGIGQAWRAMEQLET